MSKTSQPRMGFEPQRASGNARVYSGLAPPRRLVAMAMDLAMVASTERHRELIANLAAKGPVLRKAQVMRV
jgi:hypothetical protein